MTKFKVGDVVTVRADLEMGFTVRYYMSDSQEWNDVAEEMLGLVGQKVHISKISTYLSGIIDGYLLLEDPFGYTWTDEMFEEGLNN